MKYTSASCPRTLCAAFSVLVGALLQAEPTPTPKSSTTIQQSAPSGPRTLKPEDWATLRDVGEPNISPDGNLIAYVVKVADMEKDKRPAECGHRAREGNAGNDAFHAR
ncbi:MAG TPA: hypothetical protein VF345_13275 [Chthoniobacterales bacterium]